MSAPWRERLKRKMPWLVGVRRLSRLVENQFRFPILATLLDRRQQVIGGPFRGLRYTHSGIVGYVEMLGTYEQCLIPVIDSVIRRQPTLIVDVGAAFGYYALGLAMRCPESSVIAYEMDDSRANVIRDCRVKNHIQESRLQVRGKCSVADLHHDLCGASNPFLLMDVEGCEEFLLSPTEVPGLAHTEVLVEVHEMFVPGITAQLRQRFQATHVIELIEQIDSEKRPLDLSGLEAKLVDLYWTRLTRECRQHKMSWLHMLPSTSTPTGAP